MKNSSDKNTGEARAEYPKWTGLRGKTLWDWLNLLIVPLVLLVGGFLLASWQEATQRSVANQRADSQLEIEEERSQNAMLQEYFDQIGVLMIQHELDDAETFGDANSVARARTLTLLRSLNGEHKAAVLQFLRDSGLTPKEVPGVVLWGADFSNTQLPGASLSKADLFGVDLRDSDLSDTDLEGVDLRQADLRNANLSRANLSGALLNDANLIGAEFRKANLQGVSWEGSRIGHWQAFKCFSEKEFKKLTEDILEGEEIEGVKIRQRNLGTCLSEASPQPTNEFSERQTPNYP